MLELLKNWKGEVEVDGVHYNSVLDVPAIESESIHISLLSKSKRQETSGNAFGDASKTYRITVKQYMTRKSTPQFDFMAQWNNDNPMPLRTMIGTIEKETKGMVHMHLHGDITTNRMQFCMKCGKQITNPVSQFFGMGPECGGHNYTSPFSSDEELNDAIEQYRKQYLQKIEWSGWIIKSAILEFEELLC